MKKEYKEKTKMFKLHPSTHPDFEKEKDYFIKKKIKKLGGCFNDHETYKIEKEWMEYWPSRLDEILHKKWKKKKHKFLKENDTKVDDSDSDSKSCKRDEIDDHHHIRGERRKSSPIQWDNRKSPILEEKKRSPIRGEKRKSSPIPIFPSKRRDSDEGKYSGDGHYQDQNSLFNKASFSNNVGIDNELQSCFQGDLSVDSFKIKLDNETENYDLPGLLEFLKCVSMIIGDMSMSLSVLYSKVLHSNQKGVHGINPLNRDDIDLLQNILNLIRTKLENKVISSSPDRIIAQKAIEMLVKLFGLIYQRERTQSDSVLKKEQELVDRICSKMGKSIMDHDSKSYFPDSHFQSSNYDPVAPIYPNNPPNLSNSINDPPLEDSFINSSNLQIALSKLSFYKFKVENLEENSQLELYSNYYFLDRKVQGVLICFLKEIENSDKKFAGSLRNLIDRSKTLMLQRK